IASKYHWSVTIKLHPEETPDKYHAFKERHEDLQFIKDCDIGALIGGARKVVGMESMLLMEAALVRSDVISYLPGRPPEQFIGNTIGMTRFAMDRDGLEVLLLEPGEGGVSSFANRFRGSISKVLKSIADFSKRASEITPALARVQP
ncbi:MAG: hypothetical protein HQL31_02520, partial [Planctomycetes bacterium]|nr:hypothetical protein [Planctomycetota bacterium]